MSQRQIGRMVKHDNGFIGHYGSNHKHVEFHQMMYEKDHKKGATPQGYMITINTVMSAIMIFIDIYTLNGMNTFLADEKAKFVATYGNATAQASPEFQPAFNRFLVRSEQNLYQQTRILAAVLQFVSVASTWINNFVLDWYKISHPLSFLCFCLQFSILLIAANSRIHYDDANFYEETLHFSALQTVQWANLICLTLNCYINLTIQYKRQAFNYGGPIFYVTEEQKMTAQAIQEHELGRLKKHMSKTRSTIEAGKAPAERHDSSDDDENSV